MYQVLYAAAEWKPDKWLPYDDLEYTLEAASEKLSHLSRSFARSLYRFTIREVE